MFGKLTTEFELLSQFRKTESRRPPRLLTEKQSLHVFSLPFGKLTTELELLCKETQSPQFQSFGGETSGAGGAGDEGRWVRAVSVEGAGGAAGAA